jgi:hypothetical protein
MHPSVPNADAILLWLSPPTSGTAALIPAMDQPRSIASVVVALASPAGEQVRAGLGRLGTCLMGQFLGADKSYYRECRMSERKPCVLVADDSPEVRRIVWAAMYLFR